MALGKDLAPCTWLDLSSSVLFGTNLAYTNYSLWPKEYVCTLPLPDNTFTDCDIIIATEREYLSK